MADNLARPMSSAERLANLIFGLNVIAWGIAGLWSEPPVDRWTVVRLCIASLHFTVGGLLLLRAPINGHATAAQLTSAIPSLVLCGFAFRESSDPHLWPWYAQLFFAASTCFAICSLISLGSSFAVFPAIREVSAGGTYRLIRHPAYAGELGMACACLIATPSVLVVCAVLFLIPAIVWRILAEESLLRSDACYGRYCEATRWRLLPGIW